MMIRWCGICVYKARETWVSTTGIAASARWSNGWTKRWAKTIHHCEECEMGIGFWCRGPCGRGCTVLGLPPMVNWSSTSCYVKACS